MKDLPEKQSKTGWDIYKIVDKVSYLNYIYYVLLSTVLFWILSLPAALLVFLSVKLTISSLPWYFLCLLPVGPAFYALLSCLNQVKETEKVIRPFLQLYKRKFKQIFPVWTIILLVIAISWANILFLDMLEILSLFRWLNVFIIVLLVTFTLNFLLLEVHFDLPLKKSIQTTLQLSIIKSGRYSLAFMILIGTYILMNSMTVYLLLFGMGIVALLLLGNFKPIADMLSK